MIHLLVLFSRSANVWKLTDFGLSAEATSRKHHTTRYSRGTGGYRAPELLHDPGKFSNKVDMWALGCVIFELVTLRPAFTEDWETRQYSLTSDAAFDIPFSSIPSCPEFIQYHVSESILDLLHRQPRNRPRASEVSRFFLLYCQFLEFAKTDDLDDVLRATRNHPSYTDWRTLVNSRVADGELLYTLANEYEKKEEVATAATLRRVLIERSALDKYRAVLAIGGIDSSLLILRADTYFEKEYYDAAIELYKEAIDVEPNGFWLWHRLSEIHIAQNRINAAINVCSDGIKKYPNVLSAKMVLYCLYALKGDYTSAITVLYSFGLEEVRPSNLTIRRKNVDSVPGK